MKQIPINPLKIRGKFTPPPENTDITADPIDNPPKKTPQNHPANKGAKFEEPPKNPYQTNNAAIFLSICFLIIAILLPAAIPLPAIPSIIQIFCALSSIFFNLQNPHLSEKQFSRLGVNPFKIITLINCLIILLGLWQLFQFFTTSLGR